ncbi:hypothetical protein XENOCAPTIV_019020 [Xenoophorus captivus]|uniref:Uncharacterized protein n=1 Tax=Xenoophorus captivus TaxID=1517983 RepID=A0ABV0QAS2_9TELE
MKESGLNWVKFLIQTNVCFILPVCEYARNPCRCFKEVFISERVPGWQFSVSGEGKRRVWQDECVEDKRVGANSIRYSPPSPHSPPHLLIFLTPFQHHLIFPSFNLTHPPSILLFHRRAQPHYILQEIIAFVWKECREEGKGARMAPFVERRGSLKDN